MCQKFYALALLLLLHLPCLSAQDLSPDDKAIIEKQEQIISIARFLTESARISAQSLKDERKAWQKEKDDLLKEKESWPNYERDMATLKDSLKKQSELLRQEQEKNKRLMKAVRVVGLVTASAVAYEIYQQIK